MKALGESPRIWLAKAPTRRVSHPAPAALNEPRAARVTCARMSCRRSTSAASNESRLGRAAVRARAEAPARAAQHELRRADELLGRRAEAELIEQQLHRVAPLLVERLPHGGERRDREADLVEIVEADERHLLGHADAER